jgi:hypothetical protein
MKIGGIKMRKKVGTSTYIQRINTLERKLLKQVKELDDVMQKHPEIMFRLQVVEFALKHCSKNAKDFLEKSVDVMPFEIKGIQTDNGSEFLGEFTKALKKKDIKHYFNYPRYPK